VNDELRSVGLKVTLPRVRILEILEQSRSRHLTADDIHRVLLESHDGIGLATVYRVLSQFEAAGLITRRNFEAGITVFELDTGRHHDHAVCIRCGKVQEFNDPSIEERQISIAARLGYDLSDHALVLYGCCLSCSKQSSLLPHALV
jgi:Fur family transcriptional regulator, ferric uptake regulator